MVCRLFIAATAALVMMVAAASAQQDEQQGSSGVQTKTLLENEQTRVMEMRFKPGARTTTLSYPNRFLYALTDGALVFSPPGKRPYELTLRRGEAQWLPADTTSTQNETDKDVRALVVELKGLPHMAAPARGGHGGKRYARRTRGGKGAGRRRGRK